MSHGSIWFSTLTTGGPSRCNAIKLLWCTKLESLPTKFFGSVDGVSNLICYVSSSSRWTNKSLSSKCPKWTKRELCSERAPLHTTSYAIQIMGKYDCSIGNYSLLCYWELNRINFSTAWVSRVSPAGSIFRSELLLERLSCAVRVMTPARSPFNNGVHSCES